MLLLCCWWGPKTSQATFPGANTHIVLVTTSTKPGHIYLSITRAQCHAWAGCGMKPSGAGGPVIRPPHAKLPQPAAPTEQQPAKAKQERGAWRKVPRAAWIPLRPGPSISRAWPGQALIPAPLPMSLAVAHKAAVLGKPLPHRCRAAPRGPGDHHRYQGSTSTGNAARCPAACQRSIRHGIFPQ